MYSTNKPTPLSQISREFVTGDIWDIGGGVGGAATMRPVMYACTSALPVSQYPTTTRWRQTNEQTNRQTEEYRHRVKLLLLRRELNN